MSQTNGSRDDPPVHLSAVLKLAILDPRGDQVGKVGDVVARFQREGYPEVIGLVTEIGDRGVFVPVDQLSALGATQVRLSQEKVDLRQFERRPGEFLLRADVLGHRLIDVRSARFVRAYDVELAGHGREFHVSGIDTRPHSRLFGLLKARSPEPPATDWKAFEPLVGLTPRAQHRGRLLRLRRLHPAQLADLLEEASAAEGEDILGTVHRDRDLEADVFEEMDPGHQVRYLESRDDQAVAEVLSRMQPNDAADLIVELDQDRRAHILELIEEPLGAKVRQLLAFSPGTAGGLMSPDLLSVSPDSSVGAVLERLRRARELPAETLASVHVVDPEGRLVGTASLLTLIQADDDARVGEVAEDDPVRIAASADTVEVALRLADYNLTAIPVVDEQDKLLGVVSVDDVLEEILPEEWRRRERGAAPRPATGPAS
jgi:CBS domain-containing protein/sporulation protein YlmC with PRC-barrel domain